MIRDDFPDPDTPVTAVNKPTGISTSILFKLLANADFISINLPFGFALFFGTFISLFFDKNFVLQNLFYKFIYKINIKRNNFVIVQQNWLKREFKKI